MHTPWETGSGEQSATESPEQAVPPTGGPQWRLLIVGTVLGVAIVGLFVGPSLWRAARPSPARRRLPEVDERPVAWEWSVPELGPASEPAFEELRNEAVEVAARLMQRFPSSPHGTTVMGLVHNRFGNADGAVKCWERSVELDPGFAPAYHGMGVVAFRKGEYDEAAALLRKALQLDPTLSEATVQLADALICLGRTEEAVALLEERIGITPGADRNVLYSLGHAYLQLHQYEKAKTHYLAALEADPAWTYAYYGLAQACAKLGQVEESKIYLEKFKQLIGDDLEAEIEQTRSFDDLASARQNVAYICVAAGRVYRSHQNLREAEEHWLKAARIAPKDTACREELARLYQESYRVEEALQTLEELAEIEPRNVMYQLDLGVLSARSGRFDAAEEAFQKVRQLAPRRPEGYLALVGLYLQSNQKLPEAVKLAGAVVELQPTARNYALLSAACRRNGDLSGALSAIERATELDPGNDEYARLRTALREKP